MANVALTPAVAVNAVSAALAVGLASYAWRNRSRPGAGSFLGMMVAAAGWAVVNGAALLSPALAGSSPLSAAEWGISTLVPVFWLAFALEYTGREEFVSTRVLVGLAVLPAVTTGFVLLDDPLGVMWAGTCGTTFQPWVGWVVAGGCSNLAWVYVHLTYAYTLTLVGAGLLLRMVVGYESVYTDQAWSLLLGGAVPLVASVTWALGLFPLEGYDPTPAAFTVAGLAFGNAVFRYQLMDVVPATRRIGEAAAIRDLQDGVVIVDDRDRVLTMNPAAGDLFGCDPDRQVGKHVGHVLGDDSFEVAVGEEVSEFDAADGRRTFQVTVSPITDGRDRGIGHTLVFRDVTEREQRKQQLAALNRVLRHNLRNDMNVVQGYADTLSERTTDPEAEMAEFIAEQSSELVAVGSKVRDMEKIMERPRSEHRSFELGALLRDVVEEVREEYPATRTVVSLQRDLWIRSDDLVVGTVVENLVRNAVEHNDADAPSVTVEAEPDGDWLSIRVVDNGPGIPDQERRALVEGRETDLRHGSGLGLWVVNWGVTKLGGDLTFEDPDDGTAVRVRLPGRVSPPEDGESTGKAEAGAD